MTFLIVASSYIGRKVKRWASLSRERETSENAPSSGNDKLNEVNCWPLLPSTRLTRMCVPVWRGTTRTRREEERKRNDASADIHSTNRSSSFPLGPSHEQILPTLMVAARASTSFSLSFSFNFLLVAFLLFSPRLVVIQQKDERTARKPMVSPVAGLHL